MRYQRAEPSPKLGGLAAARMVVAGCLAKGDPRLGQLWGANFQIQEIIADAVSTGAES